MIFYALVSSEASLAVELYGSRAEAKAALRDVLQDEPGFEPILSIVPLGFSLAYRAADIARAPETRRGRADAQVEARDRIY